MHASRHRSTLIDLPIPAICRVDALLSLPERGLRAPQSATQPFGSDGERATVCDFCVPAYCGGGEVFSCLRDSREQATSGG
jgi:hypothetical protein